MEPLTRLNEKKNKVGWLVGLWSKDDRVDGEVDWMGVPWKVKVKKIWDSEMASVPTYGWKVVQSGPWML